MIPRLALVGLCLGPPVPVLAADGLTMPDGARQLAERVSALDSYDLPVGGFSGGAIPIRRFEGRVDRQTWRIDGGSKTTLQVLSPLRDQIVADGYDLLFQCEDRVCGGFDFRFGTEVVPAPDMHVDIRNYRFVSAMRGPDEALSLLVSRSRNGAYVQIIRVSPPVEDAETVAVPTAEDSGRDGPADLPDLAAELVAEGHVVLSDLDFSTGETVLGAGPFASVEQLAAYLRDTPDQRIALVGHTDSTGSLDANVLLSKRRAEAVKDRLVSGYGLAEGRIDAEGMGYLAPVASNLTEQGRTANRRVEAILLSTR
ncbi:OmpA family protein [Sedimentitalea sp. JM2-8]|uniref:OmpA family protein n=1 Tax=Sedimentitalea xiamensis TaxID=3050037 RepID=A0ABT7FFY8_9RHOB|nr:OmpA family protein [Sedimentitalea xiamensis]MDK3074032.1 OmpA family protein [Sedimentitalea xiamensis]